MIDVFLAEGFEELEALAPVDVLRRAGIDVQIVGVGGKIVTGAHGVSVVCDVLASQAAADEPGGVILPGGMPGTLNLAASKDVETAVRKAAAASRLVAAICAAPSVLGGYGLLVGRKATCFPGFENQLVGAEFINAPVCVDGNLITAWGAGAAYEFSFAVLDYLAKDSEAGKKMGESMRCVR